MSYYFNLPIFDDLTPEQKQAVNETRQLALGGGPGTGKSVVFLWRHIRNYVTNTRKSLLLTYTKTLEHYLRQSAITESYESGQNINRINWWLYHKATDYEEIIIDEGQDVQQNLFVQFFNYTANLSYGADRRQVVYLTKEEEEELFRWFDEEERFSQNQTINLSRNFRNSKEILLFTRSVFPNFLIPQYTIDSSLPKGLKPILQINKGWDIEGQVDSIIEIINDFRSETHNIAILVPFQNMVDNYYNAIRGKLEENVDLTKFKSDDDDFNGLSGVHITTFKSSKGTEFDTVVMPEFDKYNWILANGHRFENRVNENDYYVAFTRAKLNLFLICRNGYPDIGDRTTVNIE